MIVRRLLFLAAAMAWFILPASAQQPGSPEKAKTIETWAGQRNAKERSSETPPKLLSQKPLSTLEVERIARLEDQADDQEHTPADTLSQVEILRHLGLIYQYQADLMAAEADGDMERAERLLERAMTEVATLMEQPGMSERPRFRELYRSVVTEYERYYGVSDTVLTLPQGNIFQIHADMFATLEEVEDPLLENVMLPQMPTMTSVEMTSNRLVEASIEFLLRSREKTLMNWIGRSQTYFPMIERIFQEEGVPDELKYLALVESGLNPRARSWAHAGGMWQFIKQTGSAYGLTVNAWVDERLDPEQATRAAARHLKDLYKMYNQDWQVAMAGYNCSPRCIKRAIAKAGGTSPSFWDIYPYLPRETRGYVPMYIATSLLVSNPSAFGVTGYKSGPRYEYDLVYVHGMLSLQEVARMAGTDVATIKALNPALLRSSLPPGDKPYALRIPIGTYARFAQAIEAAPSGTKQQTTEDYVVRRGDSLGKIAKKYHVSVAELKATNDIRNNTIHTGQRLVVPVEGVSGPVTLASIPPVTVQYGSPAIRPIAPANPAVLAASRRSTPVVQASATSTASSDIAQEPEETASAEPSTTSETPTAETRIVYRVRRGDTLGSIASKYNVTIRDLQDWNNISGTQINSGQRLYLYASNAKPAQPERIVYKVRRGDNLSAIANKYGVTVNNIREWNDLSGNAIRSGQTLNIYPGKTTPQYTVYKVKRGDNLNQIAKKYGTTIDKIKEWNNLKRSTIHPGQRLKIFS